MQNEHPKKIVIVGGGFAGVNLAMKIAKNRKYQITLIDKNNYNFFPPLIYQVATGFLETSSISYPFRKLFRSHPSLQFRLGELIKIDSLQHICYLNNGSVYYDYLVFACGAETNYFGNDRIKNNAIPMKTVNDALHMRNMLLQNLEQACLVKDITVRKKLLTIVVAGGGPTGVEVAGMLAELRKYILTKDYPELRNESGQIYLVNGAPRLLEQMSEQSHRDAYNALSKLGVEIKLNNLVKDFYNDQVVLANDETIETKNLIWAAGIIAKTFQGIPTSSIGKGKRMIADQYNKVHGMDDVYAIGDICIQNNDPAYPNGHPQLAQTAIQQGINLANNFVRMRKGAKLVPFIYIDKGNMAIIGRNSAVCDLFKSKLHIGGFVALMMWLFVHLISLINYRNKLRTFFNWTAAYFSKDQSLRMIIRPEGNTEKEQPVLSETIFK
jgi:NADH:ubiquinone reductase (H+-translocating)